MKIWYQVYNVSASVDPEWRYFEAFSLCGKSGDAGNRVIKLSVGACRARDS